MLNLETVCPFCGRVSYVVVDEMGYDLWQRGMCVQDAFPELSVDEREMLISGICPQCWDTTFRSSYDEEEIPEEEMTDEEEYINCDDSDLGFDPYLGEFTYDC